MRLIAGETGGVAGPRPAFLSIPTTAVGFLAKPTKDLTGCQGGESRSREGEESRRRRQDGKTARRETRDGKREEKERRRGDKMDCHSVALRPQHRRKVKR